MRGGIENPAGTAHTGGYHTATEQLWQEFPTISLLQASVPVTEFGAAAVPTHSLLLIFLVLKLGPRNKIFCLG